MRPLVLFEGGADDVCLGFGGDDGALRGREPPPLRRVSATLAEGHIFPGFDRLCALTVAQVDGMFNHDMA